MCSMSSVAVAQPKHNDEEAAVSWKYICYMSQVLKLN